MKITKEELHKLIDGADIENLQKTYAEYSEKSSGMLIGNRLGAIVRYLKESQKPKELTLHEKLINEGFVRREPTCSYHYYINTKTQIKVTPYEEFISVETLANRINIFDIDNHSKVLEVIKFLTNFQKKEDD